MLRPTTLLRRTNCGKKTSYGRPICLRRSLIYEMPTQLALHSRTEDELLLPSRHPKTHSTLDELKCKVWFSQLPWPSDRFTTFLSAALKTYKIRKLWSHLFKFKRDLGNRLGLRKLVHERAKILRYLRSVDRDRYETALERLALEPESVEGELVV